MKEISLSDIAYVIMIFVLMGYAKRIMDLFENYIYKEKENEEKR